MGIETVWVWGLAVQLRYFVDRLCDDLAYLRNRLHNVEDYASDADADDYGCISPAVHNGQTPREWSAQPHP